MPNLVEHAERELALCGQTAEDPACAASIIEAVRAFTTYYGHSGGSASVAREQLYALLNHENLAPLTSDPDEWEDRSEMSGAPLWQNRRNPKAFSKDGGGWHWLLGNAEFEVTSQTPTPPGSSRGSQVIDAVDFPADFVPPSTSPLPPAS